MTKSKLELRAKKYEQLTEKALKKAKIAVPENSALHEIALDFKDMASRYLSDGKHYFEKGEIEIALASFAYAHAWLDAGARIGLFDVQNDSKLFTLYK